MATKTVVRYRNRPAKKRRSKKRFTLPLAVTIPLGFVAYDSYKELNRSGTSGAFNVMFAETTGYSLDKHDWKFKRIAPILLGLLAHKLAAKLGINRALGRAGVPYIRI